MISPEFFASELRRGGVDFFAGVPDSLLKSFCAWLSDNIGPSSHIIAANEGAAVALAAGHFLSTGRPGCVYMQNSGEGNAINPLASLTDADVYSIPVLLLIGWRGCPGVHDEPQHVKQGKVTLSLLETMGIPFSVLSGDEAEASAQVSAACRVLSSGQVYALVVRKDTFTSYDGPSDHAHSGSPSGHPRLDSPSGHAYVGNDGGSCPQGLNAGDHAHSGRTSVIADCDRQSVPLDNDATCDKTRPTADSPDSRQAVDCDRQSLSREEAIQIVAGATGLRDVIVSSTGMISRELFEYREATGGDHSRDFLTVGSMGHASQIALGISLEKPDRRVWCFDGDGAVIMHMGSMATVGTKAGPNFVHVVFNNGAHDSVGGQPTVGFQIDLPGVACACGYPHVFMVSTKDELGFVISSVVGKSQIGPVFLEIQVRKGNRPDLGRPTTTPLQNRDAFMDFLKSE